MQQLFFSFVWSLDLLKIEIGRLVFSVFNWTSRIYFSFLTEFGYSNFDYSTSCISDLHSPNLRLSAISLYLNDYFLLMKRMLGKHSNNYGQLFQNIQGYYFLQIIKFILDLFIYLDRIYFQSKQQVYYQNFKLYEEANKSLHYQMNFFSSNRKLK